MIGFLKDWIGFLKDFIGFLKDWIGFLKDLIGFLKDLIGPMGPWGPAHGAQKLRSRPGTQVPQQNEGVPGPTAKLRGPGPGPGSHHKTKGSWPGSRVPPQNHGVPARVPGPIFFSLFFAHIFCPRI